MADEAERGQSPEEEEAPVMSLRRSMSLHDSHWKEKAQADFDPAFLPGTPYESPLQGQRHYQLGQLPPVIFNTFLDTNAPCSPVPLHFHQASAQKNLHFNPPDTVIGIVSCGGLCPGLNDVIRSLTLFSLEVYGVKQVIGFKYGWRGIQDSGLKDRVILTPQMVKDIHKSGGSYLGSSRGSPVQEHCEEMVANLKKLGVNILFALGGDGTLKGASNLADACEDEDIAVVGLPKTIDNDVAFIQKTFGYDSATAEAIRALKAAQAEARSHKHGVGIVKLMGRHSGFIAAQAAISFAQAHIVLVPENEISLDVITALVAKRFQKAKYCVIVVAEGFGQELLGASAEKDASGNAKLQDIGVFLAAKIGEWASQNYSETTVKYIDPSYMIRSVPAIPSDAAFCMQLANNAVHEAFHGATNSLIGFWNNTFTLVPIALCVSRRKQLSKQGDLWRAVREITVSLKSRVRPNASFSKDPTSKDLPAEENSKEKDAGAAVPPVDLSKKFGNNASASTPSMSSARTARSLLND